MGDNMYTIKEIAKLANISTRTLRFYYRIGLLSPSHKDKNGYRIYNTESVDTLQQILFFKELGYSLDRIHHIMNNESFNRLESLYEHLSSLKEKQQHITNVIDLVHKTIDNIEKGETMADNQKFDAFKKEQIKHNIEKYGEEMNRTYDSDFIQQSNQQYLKKSKYEMKLHEDLTKELNQTLKEAMKTNDPSSEIAKKMCQLHKDWLCFYWPSYKKEHHLSLVEMYTIDDRFTKYYDNIQTGAAQFLFDAMKLFLM